MSSSDPAVADDDTGSIRNDLRQRTAARLLDSLEQIADDAVALFPFSGSEALDVGFCSRIGNLLVRLLAFSVRDGRVDSHSGLVADVQRVLGERGLPMERLFTFTYLTERAALDELALDEAVGATAEPWPVVAQMVRRASFDLLGACTEHAPLDAGALAMTDALTTLYTRPLFEAVLAKEVIRAGRFGYPTSVIVFNVDRLSTINREHGYGVGDSVLARLGNLIRRYFRQHDWVARLSEDSIAVLLPRTEAEHASDLAERVRSTVEKRLQSIDHRSDRPVPVTLSAGVVNLNIEIGDVVDPERFLAEAEAAVERAQRHGRNSVERVDSLSPSTA
jgi:diguanylate cyclase (GGDEF)-like protein